MQRLIVYRDRLCTAQLSHNPYIGSCNTQTVKGLCTSILHNLVTHTLLSNAATYNKGMVVMWDSGPSTPCLSTLLTPAISTVILHVRDCARSLALNSVM